MEDPKITANLACGIMVDCELPRPVDAKHIVALIVKKNGQIDLEIPWPEGLTFKEALLAWKGVQ